MSTAIVVAIRNGAAFHKGRDFAAWLELVPKRHATGAKSEAAWYQRAWEPISAEDPDPGSTRRCPRSQARTCTDGLDDSARSPGAPQRIDCSQRQRAGADCLGGCCRAVKNIARKRIWLLSESSMEKTPNGFGKRKYVSDFPTLRLLLINLLFESASEQLRRKSRHNGVPETCA
ncbi:MAG: hypothetical protein WA426_20990 [Silvibacterium sp.]